RGGCSVRTLPRPGDRLFHVTVHSTTGAPRSPAPVTQLAGASDTARGCIAVRSRFTSAHGFGRTHFGVPSPSTLPGTPVALVASGSCVILLAISSAWTPRGCAAGSVNRRSMPAPRHHHQRRAAPRGAGEGSPRASTCARDPEVRIGFFASELDHPSR